MFGQMVKKKYLKKNFYNIRKILEPLRQVWIERVPKTVYDITTSVKKQKTISSCCESQGNEHEVHGIHKNPIRIRHNVLLMR